MSLSAEPTAGFRLNGWHVLGIITAFFAAVIAVDVAFVVMAVRTFPGEVSATPYEDGLAYNRRRAQFEAQERLGWQATAAAEAGFVSVEMRDRSGAPLSGLSLSGRLERPATEAGRIILAFRETRAGRYVAHVANLGGAWDLTAHAADTAGHRFDADRRLTWR